MKQKGFYFRLFAFILFFMGGLCTILWGVYALRAAGSAEQAVSAKASVITEFGSGEKGNAAAPEVSAQPKNAADWRLVLVNSETPMETAPQPDLKTVYGSHQVDGRILADLQQLLAACENAGYTPLVCSAYRTEKEQAALYEANVSNYISEGNTRAEAETLADRAVARPGTSEHQLGLAVDIVSENNQRLDDTQGENPAQIWLMDNAWNYGFILRYPKDKEGVTMKMYEPWHYRYVGIENAKAIKEGVLCLEEFLEK